MPDMKLYSQDCLILTQNDIICSWRLVLLGCAVVIRCRSQKLAVVAWLKTCMGDSSTVALYLKLLRSSIICHLFGAMGVEQLLQGA